MEDRNADIAARLAEKYPREEAEETVAELRQLIDEGYLDTPDDYSDVKPADSGVVKAMCLHAAHDCNLRCKYCFADTGEYHMHSRCLLSAETGKKALDWLVAHSGKRKNLEVDFFGGEPLMNFPVIKEVVAYGRELEKRYGKVFKFTTTTNAVLMNDEIMDFLNREMDNVVISIDGRPEVHDRMRPTPNGKGSYDLIIEKAKKFARRRGQQRYYLRGTFTRYNLDFANDVLHLADQGFEQLSIEPVVTDESHDYAIRESDLPRVFEEYERLGREYVIRRRNPDTWFSFFHFMVDLTGGPCLRKRLTGCGAGNEYVAVTADGATSTPATSLWAAKGCAWARCWTAPLIPPCRRASSKIPCSPRKNAPSAGRASIAAGDVRPTPTPSTATSPSPTKWNASWNRSVWSAPWPFRPSSAKMPDCFPFFSPSPRQI